MSWPCSQWPGLSGLGGFVCAGHQLTELLCHSIFQNHVFELNLRQNPLWTKVFFGHRKIHNHSHQLRLSVVVAAVDVSVAVAVASRHIQYCTGLGTANLTSCAHSYVVCLWDPDYNQRFWPNIEQVVGMKL